MRGTESVTRRIHEHLSAADLTITQFGVLEALQTLVAGDGASTTTPGVLEFVASKEAELLLFDLS